MESYGFSDKVISDVVLRVRPQHHWLYAQDGDNNGRSYSQLGFCSSPRDNTESVSPSKCQAQLIKATFALDAPVEECELPVVRRPYKRCLSAAKRERSRINQARYRNKQREHFEGLQDRIRELREEIQDLDMRREELERCSPTYTSVWTVASEYFRVFRYGFKAPVMEPTLAVRPSECQDQMSFLLRAMAPDVTDGTVSGVIEILENWKKLSIYHGDTHVQLKSLKEVDENSILAVATINLTITEKTLTHVCPHLLRDTSSLSAKLLNQRLVVCGSVRFDWDAAACRVVRLDSRFDIVSPMLKLLNNLEDVARVLDKASKMF